VASSYHEYKDNWSEGSNLLLLQLGGGDISRLTPSHQLRPLFTHLKNFFESQDFFTKNGDKFGWVKLLKYW